MEGHAGKPGKRRAASQTFGTGRLRQRVSNPVTDTTMITFADRARRYAAKVLDGSVLACKWTRAAAKRFEDDLKRRKFVFRFDEEEVDRVCVFMECLPHVKGEWAKPRWINGEAVYPKLVLEDWQVFVLANIFGWRHVRTGFRRFRRVYLEVARKNAKSTFAAGIALYMLGPDGEEGAEIYAAATKKEQAKAVWDVARQMVMREPDLGVHLGIEATKSLIQVDATGSVFKPLARDYGSLDGLNTHCFISDELHAQKDRGLYDVLDSSDGARSQPLGIAITTAGSNRAGVCYEQRSYVTMILNDVLARHDGMGYAIRGKKHADDTYFGMIYTLDTAEDYGDGREGDHWGDPAMWIKANPNLGVSAMLDKLEASALKAKASTLSQNEFRTKHANQWVNADVQWMDLAHWTRCANPDLRDDDFAGEECYTGLDGAFKTDVFAKAKVFRRGDRYTAFMRYFMPEANVTKDGNEHFAAWAEEGRIGVSSGEVVDIEQVRDDIHADSEKHSVAEVAYDPLQLTQFASEMIDEGYEMVEVRPVVMNFSPAMKLLDELVRDGRFEHDGDPILEWMVSNVVCHTDAKDNIYPRKEAPANKIDGVIALLMALSRASAHESGGSMADFLSNPIVISAA